MTRQTPLWLQQGSYAASVDRRLPAFMWPTATVSGCAVSVASGMTVNIATGFVAVPTNNNTGSVVCASDAVEQVTLAAAPGSGSNRYDVVICQARGNDLDGGANNDFIFTTVTGTAAASPTVPATPANAVALANIYVPGGSASVVAGNITDVRVQPGSAIRAHAYRNAAWQPSASGANVTMDTFDVGPSGWWSSGLFVCPQPGTYLVSACAAFTANAAGIFGACHVYVNGVLAIRGAPSFSNANGNIIGGLSTGLVHNANRGDTIACYCIAGAASLAGITGTAGTYMSAALLP